MVSLPLRCGCLNPLRNAVNIRALCALSACPSAIHLCVVSQRFEVDCSLRGFLSPSCSEGVGTTEEVELPLKGRTIPLWWEFEV